MEIARSAESGAEVPITTGEAERQVADLLPIEAPPDVAATILEDVPFWFHTFALNRSRGIYTPGAARDHRYRVSLLPEDLSGMSVLDVGTFDGFYAFLAERRGASRVVAVDNEQYRLWVASRWGIELKGGDGFRAIARQLASEVEYHKMDAFALADLDERFDFIYCFGLLHRVENPLGLLRVLRERVTDGGSVLLETYGLEAQDNGDGTIKVARPGTVYPRDEFIYWAFGHSGLEGLARLAGFARAEELGTSLVAGHPRVMGRLVA